MVERPELFATSMVVRRLVADTPDGDCFNETTIQGDVEVCPFLTGRPAWFVGKATARGLVRVR
jgi:hypothetical protein